MPVKETAAYQGRACFVEMIPQTLPIEPVVELVHQFHGVKPLAVASGGKREIVSEDPRRPSDILGKFQVIVTVEDYRRGKPAPDPFLEAARQLGVASREMPCVRRYNGRALLPPGPPTCNGCWSIRQTEKSERRASHASSCRTSCEFRVSVH
jgi:hypothetical protein